MMKKSSGMSRAAVRAVAKPAAVRSSSQQPIGNGDFILDLPTTIEGLNASANVVGETEKVVEFPVICLFNEDDAGNRSRFRFVTSGLSIKDKSGVEHRLVLDLEPLVSEEDAKKLQYRAIGKLTVRGVFVGGNDYKKSHFVRNNQITGDVKYEFTCTTSFVRFEVEGVHTGKVDDPDEANG